MSVETIKATTPNTDTNQQPEVYGASTDEINRELLGKSGGLRVKVSNLLRQAKNFVDGAVTGSRNKITGMNLSLQNRLLERSQGALERKTARHNAFSHQQQEGFDEWRVAAQNELVADESSSQQIIDNTRFGALRAMRQTVHNTAFSNRLRQLDEETAQKRSTTEESIVSSRANVDAASDRVGVRESAVQSKKALIEQRTSDFEARKTARLKVDTEAKDALLGRAEVAKARKAMREALKQDGATQAEVQEILEREFSKDGLTVLGRQAAAARIAENVSTKSARELKSSESSLDRVQASLENMSARKEKLISDMETAAKELARLQEEQLKVRDALRNTDKTLDNGDSNPEYHKLRSRAVELSSQEIGLEIDIESMRREVNVTLPRRSDELTAKMTEIRESINSQTETVRESKIRAGLARTALGLHLDHMLA